MLHLASHAQGREENGGEEHQARPVFRVFRQASENRAGEVKNHVPYLQVPRDENTCSATLRAGLFTFLQGYRDVGAAVRTPRGFRV